MEHLLSQSPHTSHHGPWSPFHEPGIDYDGDSYMTAYHHVNGEQGSYQHLHYESFHHPSYVIAQNEATQHASLTPPDTSVSYWPTGQVPTIGNGPPLSALPLDPMYYPQSCYENQNISPTEHRPAATEDHFQPGLASACVGGTYGTTGLIYPESDTTLVTPGHATGALPALPQNPSIAHNQSESGHDPVPQDATPQPALYEGTATFPSADPNYAQIGPYVDPFTTAAAARQQQQQQQQQHYTPPLAREDRQQPYAAASTPAPEAQVQYVAPTPTPTTARSKPKTEPPGLPLRAKSPMGHLPYLEDLVAVKVERRRRPSSVPSASSGDPHSPSPASTPMPLTPVQQTLTFITYPETEPRAHRDGRGGSGADSDDHDDDGGSSPLPRGRRGKKQPKKDPFLACFFCRGRKIACHPKNEGGEDRTCTQCAKRHLPCQYPLTSRRGQRKPQDSPAVDLDGALGSCSPPSSSAAGVIIRTTSKSRPRASSKLSTSSLVSAV